ncbi:transporter substrate-binding domain-containing protein [Maribrevibacterium harenarium]|uniref:diguanylate cyclase n=1 Tax=Maribrevibacterium harenarium TaxID=2589817 RepID=A0A501WG67_9GAMM|nr:transporter substrate-binding domain-containing protein [Maribrevibacterium harenarium]TPE47350.1 transporter substrate-binding domain-containing protein [Maribrevibacterium harenarium]
MLLSRAKFVKAVYVLLMMLLVSYASAESEKVTLRLQWKHQFEFAGFYMAKELGYYAEAGLDVDILEYENGMDIVKEVSEGRSDFGIWGSGIIERAQQGEPIVFLANYFKRSPLALATSADISFPSELEGKRLMVSDADIKNANYTQMFRTFKVDVSKIEFVQPTFDVQDFIDGKVDGVSIFLTNEPYILKKNGVPYNIIDPNNFGVELYDVNVFTSRDFAERSPEQTAAFVEASNKGWYYALEHIDEAVELIKAKYDSQNKSRDHLVYEAQQTVRMMQPKNYPIGSIDLNRVTRIGNLFNEMGLTQTAANTNFVFNAASPGVALTSDELTFLYEHKDIKVAMMPDFTPFSFVHGSKVQGYEHDLLTLLSEKTGLQFKPEYGIWNRGLSAFKERQVDMIASISYKPERTDFTLFTEPYYEIPIMIYVRDDFGSYDGIDSLRGKKVGVLKDVFYVKELKQLGTMELVIYETYEQLTKALVYGQVDALMQNLTNIDSLIKDNAYTNLRLAGELQLPTIQKEDLRFGVRSDYPELHSILQKGLDAITVEETLALSNRWLGIRANETAKSISFNRPEREYLAQKGAITMCVDPSWMPLEGIDDEGKHVGVSADILALVAKNTGLNLRLVPTSSWAESMAFAQSRRCDLLTLAMETPSRKEFLNFTLPYLSYPFVIATRDSRQFIDNMNILNGKKLAMLSGYSTVEVIAKDYPNIEIVEVDTLVEGVQKVRSGEAYGYIDALPVIASAIQREGFTDLYIAGKMDHQFELGIATRNDEPMLLDVMQKALSSVDADDIQAISNKWLAVRFESRVDYSLLYKVVAGFAVLLLLGLWRHSVMQKTKKMIEAKNKELQVLANTDALTGLYNRHRVEESLEQYRELGKTFSVIILDIDNFKRINDIFGHAIGDSTLVEFAQMLTRLTRRADVVGRWGGEEFLVVLPDTQELEALKVAEALRAGIARHTFSIVGEVTASIGVAAYMPNETASELVSRADDALYYSKEHGRNQVTGAKDMTKL